MDVPNVIVENTFLDWKKNDVSKEERSVLLKNYLKERKISEGELSRELGIPKSTINDWISLRQSNKEVTNIKLLLPKKLMIFSLSNRLIFLLDKETPKDLKTMNELAQLRNKLNEIL